MEKRTERNGREARNLSKRLQGAAAAYWRARQAGGSSQVATAAMAAELAGDVAELNRRRVEIPEAALVVCRAVATIAEADVGTLVGPRRFRWADRWRGLLYYTLRAHGYEPRIVAAVARRSRWAVAHAVARFERALPSDPEMTDLVARLLPAAEAMAEPSELAEAA